MSRINAEIHPFIEHLPGRFDAEQMQEAANEAAWIIGDVKHPLTEYMHISRVTTKHAVTPDGLDSGFINVAPMLAGDRAEAKAALNEYAPALTKTMDQALLTKTKFGDIISTTANTPSFTINHAPFDGEVSRHKDAGSTLSDNVSCVVSLLGEAEFFVEDHGRAYDLTTKQGDLMFLFSPQDPGNRLYHGADVIGEGPRISLGLLARLMPRLVEVVPAKK